jgi:hypothetical protein
MRVVTTEPRAALLELARHGSFSPMPGGSLYYGRYALQDLISGEAVNALLDQGFAEQQNAREADRAVFPTRAGFEEALRHSIARPDAGETVLAVLGSREWERRVNGRAHLAGLFLSSDTTVALLEGLAATLEATPRPDSTHLETLGGIIPAALAEILSGRPLEGAPDFELVPVPPSEADLVNLARRYRFILDVRPKNGTCLLLQWVGPGPRMFGPLTLRALAEAMKEADPSVQRAKPWLALTDAIAAFPDKIELDSVA